MKHLEDLRLIAYNGVLYMQFVGTTQGPDRNGKLWAGGYEGRQWLGRLDRLAQVRCQHPSALSRMRLRVRLFPASSAEPTKPSRTPSTQHCLGRLHLHDDGSYHLPIGTDLFER